MAAKQKAGAVSALLSSASKSKGRGKGKPFAKANPHAFKPGASGNPQGRPKRTRLSEALIAKLAEASVSEETVAERVAQALIDAALQGNVQAIREIGDRCEGRPKQMIEVDATLRDWRALAQANGLSERDVIAEAQAIIQQSAAATGDAESD